jgi:class 3 adenylate cyclase
MRHVADHKSPAKRVDRFGADDWNHLIGSGSRQAGAIAEARRTLPIFHHYAAASVVWGFDQSDDTLRLFSGQRVSGLKYSGDAYRDRRDRCRELIRLGRYIFQHRESRPSLAEMCGRLQSGSTDARAILSAISKLKGQEELCWSSFGNMLMVGIFNSRASHFGAATLQSRSGAADKSASGATEISGRYFAATASRSLEKIHDFHLSQAELWNSVPPEYFSLSAQNVERLVRVFCDPISFAPYTEAPADAFLWPWQRCLGSGKGGKQLSKVKHVPIETTSVVLDLRSSTAAMSMANDPAEFSSFVERIVERSKSSIVSNGGFFDKETGDGVIGHFAPSGEEEMQQLPPVKAGVIAAAEIVRLVSEECSKFQRRLLHGLDGLAPAVGVHTAPGVWLLSGSQVRAIGGSVVGAARLCSAGDPGEILVSNSTFECLCANELFDEMRGFVRRRIEMKGVGGKTGVFAYSRFPVGTIF